MAQSGTGTAEVQQARGQEPPRPGEAAPTRASSGRPQGHRHLQTPAAQPSVLQLLAP